MEGFSENMENIILCKIYFIHIIQEFFTMENFINELGTKKILSKEDIILLKDYINKKYIDSSDNEKSNILSKTVHQILDKNFLGLKIEYTKLIKTDLIKNTLLKDGKTILLLDIFNSYILLKDRSQDFLESLLDWTNLHVENKVSKTDLEEYYSKLNAVTENTETYNDIICTQANLEINVNSNITNNFVDNNISITSELQDINDFNTYTKKLTSNFVFPISIKVLLMSKAFRFSCYLTLAFMILFFKNNYIIKEDITYTSVQTNIQTNKTALRTSVAPNLPEYFMYKDVNINRLKKYLIDKDSILADEPYFSTLISISKEYNLNPLVIFAITGQEQGFVPKKDADSKIIANNPYNVYHSWKEYNTNIEDATKIVCNTIINLSKDLPKDEEPFQWINKKYAEDKNWSKGVKQLYNDLENNELIKDSGSKY